MIFDVNFFFNANEDFLVLTLIDPTKVINYCRKTHFDAINACVNGMWQLGFNSSNVKLDVYGCRRLHIERFRDWL